MENKTEKIFVGSGKEKFDGNMVDASVCLTDIPKEADQYGKTHYIEINTYKPEEKKVVSKQDDDLPF